MKRVLVAAILVFLCGIAPTSAKERNADLDDYARRSDAIIVGNVLQENYDGSVTVQILDQISGSSKVDATIIGETGHCVVRGPIANFVKKEKRYIFFLLPGNRPGRLTSLLSIGAGDMVSVAQMSGFVGKDGKTPARTLSLVEVKKQIQKAVRRTHAVK